MRTQRLLLFLSLLCLTLPGLLPAQNTLDLAGLPSTQPAFAAYSLRKLSSTYTGFAIEVRRSGDNTTQNIGFDASGNLDASALTAFVGSNSGFVRTWYDQSGNNYHAVQATAANQPVIINAGTLILNNTRPAISFSGSNGCNLAAFVPTTAYPVSMNLVANRGSASTKGAFLKFGGSGMGIGVGIGSSGGNFDNNGTSLILLKDGANNGWCPSNPNQNYPAVPFVSTSIQASGTGPLSIFLNGNTISISNAATTPINIGISDITELPGTLTAQGQNGTAEGACMVIDNLSSTKWLDFANANPSTRASWLQWQLSGPGEVVNSYTLTSANDAPERDPKNWNLQGSNDGGATWTTLDTRTNETFSARFQKKTYSFSNTVSYTTYRLNITSVNNPASAVAVQLAELELLNSNPTARLNIGGYISACNQRFAQVQESEVIVHATALSSNDRASLECNQFSYYSIALSNISASVCSGINYTGIIPTGPSYTWGSPVISPAGAISGATVGTNQSVFSQTLTNNTASAATATYTVTPSCGTAFTITLTVNPGPVPTLSSTQTPAGRCSGVSGTYTATSSTAGVTFSWTRAAIAGISNAAASGATATITETLTNTTTGPITVYYAITMVTPSGCSNTQTVPVTINPSNPSLSSSLTPPAICSTTPFSYTPTSLTAAATFSWSRAAVAGISNAAATGTENPNETLVNTTTAAINVVYIYTTTAAGCTGSAQNVTVSVRPTPTLSSALTAPARCSNVSTTYTATSATGGTNFSWTRATVTDISNAAGSGTGNANEQLNNTGVNPVTVNYIYTLTANTCTNTQTVSVTINPSAKLSSSLTPSAICSNTSFNYTPTSATTGTTFSWSRAAVAGISNVAASGTNDPNETLVNTTANPVNVTYVYTLSANSCTNPQNVVVTVNPRPTLNSSLTPPARCSNVSTTYTATSATTGTSFAWTRAAVTDISNPANSGSGAAITEALTNNGTAPVAVTYAITLSANACTNTQNVTLNINPSAVLTSTLTPPARCSNVSTTYSPTSATTGVTYTWSRANVTGITPATGSGATGTITETLTNNTTGPITVSYAITLTANGCGNTQIIPVTINPSPTLSSSLTPSAICSNTLFSYTPTSATTGTTFSWSRAAVAGITNAAASGTDNPNETLENTTANAINVVYTYTLSANSCNNNQNVTVSVRPTPTAGINGSTTVCVNGAAPNVTFSNPQNIALTVSYNINGGANTTVNIGANATTNVSRSTATIGTFTYNLVNAYYQNAPGCTAPVSGSATIVVAPLSTITRTSAANTENQSTCANTPINDIVYTITGSGAAPSVTGLPAGVNATFNAGVLTINGASSASGLFTYTVTTAGPCAPVTRTGTINIAAALNGTLTATENSGSAANDNIICKGSAVLFTATPGFTLYRFYVNGILVQNASPVNIWSSSTLNNNDIVRVEVFNSVSCSGFFNSITITAIDPSSAAPTLVADKTSICPGEAITFTASGGSAYTFVINGMAVQSGSSNQFTSSSLAQGDAVRVELSGTNTCSAPSNNILINLKPIPVGTLTTTTPVICEGANTLFTATPGFSQYTFIVNGSAVQGPSPANTYSSNALFNPAIVNVSVTNSIGCTADFLPLAVTVNNAPAGSVLIYENSGTPNDQNVCPGATIDFVFNGGYSNYRFLRNGITEQNGPSNTFSSNSITPADVVTVEVTNAAGCKKIFTAPAIMFSTLPAGSLSFSGTVCAGQPITLNAASGYVNYAFTVNGVVVQNSTDNTYSSTLLNSGDLVGARITNAEGCEANLSPVTVILNPQPTGILSLTENSGSASNDSRICTGAATTFTAPPGLSDYNFLLNGVSVQQGVANTYSNSSLINNDKVEVAVTNAAGCIGLLNAIIMTVHPVTAAPPILGSSAVCAGGNTQLINLASPGIWSSDNTNIATINATTGMLSGIAAGTATVRYLPADGNGCGAATTMTVEVKAQPVPTLNGPNPICQGSTVNIYSTEAGQSNYSWTIIGGNITSGGGNSDNTVEISWTGTGSKNVTVNYTDANGCSGASSASVANAPNPALPVISGPATVCNGTTGTLYTTQSGGGRSDYAWTVTGGIITGGGGTNDASATITWNTPGTGSVTVNFDDINGCRPTSATVFPVTVKPLPSASISGNASLCINAPQPVITFTGASGTAPFTFSYRINGGALQTIVSTGNTATINVPTNTAGTFVYALASVSDAGSTVCSQSQTGSATITIAAAPSVIVNNPAAVCAPGTIDITAASVTAGSTTGTTYTYWMDASATSPLSNASALSTSGTYYIKGTNTSGCGIIKPVSITVNSKPNVVITNPPAVCSPATVNLTNASVTNGSTAGLSYTYWTDAAGTIAYANPATAAAGTYYVRGTVSATGCSDIRPANVSINTAPTLLITNPAPVCSPNTVDITAPALRTGSTAGLNISYWTNAAATIAFGTPTAATNGTYYIKGSDANGCSDTKPVIVTVTTTGTAPNFNPATSSICMGTILPLTAGTTFSSASPSFASSATLNLAIPDNAVNGMNHTLAVSGIPAAAVINNVRINFNINHGKTGDLIINLRAPNNKVLNLVNREGNLAANFTNTNISANASSSIVGAAAPFTGTYLPEATVGIDGAQSVTPFIADAASFNELYSIPNGNWTLSIRDAVQTTGGTLSNWSITISYTLPAAPQNFVWTPSTGLFADASGTVPYSGQAVTTVYAKPATSGNLTYTATATSAATCNGAGNVSISVNPIPSVSLTANYCGVPGKVTLTATSVPAGATFTWNTGQTGASIDVDIADTYVVTATLAGGCSSSASISVAEELVVNGDFTAGNTGFITDYNFKPDLPGVNNELVPDTGADGYGVGTNGQDYHNNFWGLDHTNNTTGPRNFMLVNGKGSTLKIWKTTVDVLPSTTYYFSAWGMSLNSVGPFARLQFNVNGAQVGTIANLATGVNSNANNGWTRFYGTWTSGPATTRADVEITNLEPSLSGNDFGIDDVSFGTLSTFITLSSSPTTVNQTVCSGNPITPIEFDLGSGGAPVVSGLPAGITSSFNGVNLVISGTPTVRGSFPISITTTGCNPITSTANINVNGPTIALQSGNSTTIACRGTALTPLEYNIGGTATGAEISSGTLPAGVTASFAGNIFTISGTPSVSGIFNFTIRTTGTCGVDSLSATITVRDQSITLTSATASPSACINSTLSPSIVYTIGGTGTGASVSGLPAGMSGSYAGGLFVISGAPTASGPFNYTVTTSGTCTSNTASGTITVKTAPVLTLSSAAGSNNQTICVNNPIAGISYVAPDASSVSITSGALPAGVAGSFNAGTYTISGTPSVSGTFNYTLTAVGSCGSTNVSGTINVPVQAITLSSGNASPSLCINSVMAPIVYTFSGSATSASASGLPAGVTASVSGDQLSISGTPITAGTFNYTITTSGNCTPATRTGTITVNPTAGGGSIASVSICRGGSGSLTLTGQSGTIQSWSMSTNGGSTWTPIANTSISQTYSAINIPTQYRATVNNGCGNVFSTVATVRIKNYWMGTVSNDFNNPANWSEGILPSLTCPDLIIPGGAPNMPVLGSGSVSANNLVIEPLATFTVSGGTIRVAGNIFNNGIFNTQNGTVELNGTIAQNISGSQFAANTIRNLVVNNSSGINISTTAGSPLRISGALTFGNVNNSVLNTGNNLVISSNASGTARVGDLTNNGANSGNSITGRVTVERFIPAYRSWRLLSIPLKPSTQTINAAWQEGVVNPDLNYANNLDPNPGYGMHISGSGSGLGFDPTSNNNASVKTYNPTTGGWAGIPNTNAMKVTDSSGYMVFVRGNRSTQLSLNASAPTTGTILRASGELKTGTQSINIPGTAAPYALLGNPFASAIDLRKLSRTSALSDGFLVWDPKLGGSSNVGGYQYITRTGADYTIFPGGGSYGSANSIMNTIQSGQAFMMQHTGAGTLTIAETAKDAGSSNAMFRPTTGDQPANLSVILHKKENDGSFVVTDGARALFSNEFDNNIDVNDFRKSDNVAENFSILQAGIALAINNRKPVIGGDTIQYRLNRLKLKNYRFEITISNLEPGTPQAFLEDGYTQSQTPLTMNGTTTYDFVVTMDSAAWNPLRFRVVFKPINTVPVSFIRVNGTRHQTEIHVDWATASETGIARYQVERSADGRSFSSIGAVTATGNGTRETEYRFTDHQPLNGDNFYRIRSIGTAGEEKLSTIVKVAAVVKTGGMAIYPNPVTGGEINLMIDNMPRGIYTARIINNLGQVIAERKITHQSESSAQRINTGNMLRAGNYKLEVIRTEQNSRIIIPFISQ